nr:MAG TPA: hypothetical protein [Caudoviricetes sp.]
MNQLVREHAHSLHGRQATVNSDATLRVFVEAIQTTGRRVLYFHAGHVGDAF